MLKKEQIDGKLKQKSLFLIQKDIKNRKFVKFCNLHKKSLSRDPSYAFLLHKYILSKKLKPFLQIVFIYSSINYLDKQ